MYLEVTFNDGTTLDVGLSNSHTVQVIGPGNTIENAFAVSGVASVQLVEGDVPAPEAAAAPSEDAPAADPVHAAADAAVADATPADVTEAAAADPPVAAPEAQQDGSGTSSDTSATTSSEPQASTADSTVGDAAHDEAVAQVQDNLAAAADAKPKDKAELIQVIQADIDSALTNWPDSAQLQDAKAQLEQLAAEA